MLCSGDIDNCAVGNPELGDTLCLVRVVPFTFRVSVRVMKPVTPHVRSMGVPFPQRSHRMLFSDPKFEGTYVCDCTNLSMEDSSKWLARSFLLHSTSILLISQPLMDYGTV